MWSFTPLHEAIIKNRAEICSLLLSYKAQPYLENCYQKTAFDLAAEQNPDLNEKLIFEYLGYSLFNAINDNDYYKVKRILNSNIKNYMTNKTDYINNDNNSNNLEDISKKSISSDYSKKLANFKHCRTLETVMVSFDLNDFTK
jgi:ankyrin repeat protein